MTCKWNVLVECGVSLTFMVIMIRDSHSRMEQNREMRLLAADEGSKMYVALFISFVHYCKRPVNCETRHLNE